MGSGNTPRILKGDQNESILQNQSRSKHRMGGGLAMKIACPSCGKAVTLHSDDELSEAVNVACDPVKAELLNTRTALDIANTAVVNLQKQLDDATRPTQVLSVDDVVKMLAPVTTEQHPPA